MPNLDELTAQLADVDGRIAAKQAEKDAKYAEIEALKAELRELNAERDPIFEEVSQAEAEARRASGVPLTTIGGPNG